MSFPELLEGHGWEAVRVASLVGSLLLLINQHDAVTGGAALRWGPAVLTYCVPFCVFLYGKRTSVTGQATREANGVAR